MCLVVFEGERYPEIIPFSSKHCDLKIIIIIFKLIISSESDQHLYLFIYFYKNSCRDQETNQGERITQGGAVGRRISDHLQERNSANSISSITSASAFSFFCVILDLHIPLYISLIIGSNVLLKYSYST